MFWFKVNLEYLATLSMFDQQVLKNSNPKHSSYKKEDWYNLVRKSPRVIWRVASRYLASPPPQTLTQLVGNSRNLSPSTSTSTSTSLPRHQPQNLNLSPSASNNFEGFPSDPRSLDFFSRSNELSVWDLWRCLYFIPNAFPWFFLIL